LTADAVKTFSDYLRTNPDDADTWLQLALLYQTVGQIPAAESAVFSAVQRNQKRAVELINSNPQLISIADPLFRRLRAQQQQRTANPFGPVR
jgi:predicted Zn-dependent protease